MPKQAKLYKFRVVVPETYLASYIVMARNAQNAIALRALGHGTEEFAENKIPNMTYCCSELDTKLWHVEEIE